MKVLFFYQHFWPDSPPYANMLRVIGDGLVKSGNSVSVLTGQPSYKNTDLEVLCPGSDVVDGVEVKRLALLPLARRFTLVKMLGKALFPFRALISICLDALRGKRHDIIIAATIPPVLNGMSAYLAAKCTGAKFVYHLQDIYPEIGAVGGLWSVKSVRHKVLYALDTRVCRWADRCIVLSEDMAVSLLERGISRSNISVINNFMLSDFDAAVISSETIQISQQYRGKQCRFRFVFAGNLGRFQGLEMLLSAFLDTTQAEANMELHFVGDGVMANSLKKMASNADNVFFYGQHSFAAACSLMSQCDAGVVSVQPDVYKYAYPSKTLTYLGIGLPVLAFIENQSSMATDIREFKLGVSGSNENEASVQLGYQNMIDFVKSGDGNRERIKSYYESHMTATAVVQQWNSLVDVLEKQRKTGVSSHG